MEETLLLKDLNCANCAAKIEDRIRKMDVVETANFTIATHQLKLTGSWEDREALKRDIQDICDSIEEGVTVADYERKSKAAMDDHGHDHAPGLKHYHDETMQSVSLTIDGDVDPAKFMPWVNEIAQSEGPSLLRWKGILAFKNEPKRFVFQGVHMMLDGDLQRDWRADEHRQSRLVFIGHDLNEDKLRQGFLATAA